MGTEKSKGMTIYSLSGHVKRPGQFEEPLGVTLRQLLELSGGMREGHELKFWTPGGSSTPILTAEHLDLPLDYEPENTSLKSMLADHRMINVVPHRALFDAVMTAMLVLEYPYDAVLRRASSPTLLLHADVPFALNALPKALRFQWEPDTKRWLRKTKECDLDKVTGAWKKTKERLAAETGNQAFASAALRKVPA
jgi:hypothetical protein